MMKIEVFNESTRVFFRKMKQKRYDKKKKEKVMKENIITNE